MKVHNAPRHNMDHFDKECAHLFHNKQSKDHLFSSFCIQFFKQRVSIAFQHALKFVIKRKIALASDACYTPSIIIRSHDLHAGDIKRVVGEIASLPQGLTFSLFFGSCELCILWPFLGLPFLSPL